MKPAAFLLTQTLLWLALSTSGADTRLAIGTFGLTPENRNAALADIVASRLSTVPGIDLVERRELNAVLKETTLGLSGIVRANDAVRVGALVRADHFLLGSSISINATNRLIVRSVDARTGIIRSIGVFLDNPKIDILAAEIAAFAREEVEHPPQEHKDFLAIGVVQNLGINNRFSEFPAQMRGSIAAALGNKVTVLEREIISFLADEVRMDMAGLTESQGKKRDPMQFGFWLVDGFYQSYEVAEPEVQLRLRVERVFGGQRSFMLQGRPTEQYFAKICDTIEQALKGPGGAVKTVPPTRKGEIKALEARARQLVDYRSFGPIKPRTFPRWIWIRTADNPDKMKNALDEATRVFESILLLDPENNAAKMRLAGCLIYEGRQLGQTRAIKPEQKARADDYFREVIATGDPEYADDARICLALSCGGIQGIHMLHQFEVSSVELEQKERFRYHRSDLLRLAEHNLPVEAVMPCVRDQLLDELADLKNSTNEPVRVSFDKVLFGYRFKPQTREQTINALLLELLERFPDLKPHILLAAAGEQTTTNSPVTAQFLASLKETEEHPERVWRASSYFRHLSSTVEEETDVSQHGGCTLYQRMFDNRQYLTVVAAALARQRAAEKRLAPPLTAIGKMRLAESYMALKKWKEALDLFNELPEASIQAKNECRRQLGAATESEDLTEADWKDKTDIQKVQLAYECISRGQYSAAVAVLDSMAHRTVQMSGGGPWGHAFTPVLPSIVADECRVKAGKSPIKDPVRFELGETPYVGFIRDGQPRMFSFEAEGEDLWMATYSQIKMFRGDGPFSALRPIELNEFERSTRTGNTSICVASDYIWAGTFDDGLLEFNRRTKACRRLTMKDGLLLNRISGLKLQGQTLWIAYRNGANGGIGILDVTSHKFSSLTPSLSFEAGSISQPHYNQALLDNLSQAPSLPISSMAAGEPGEMWFAVDEKGVQRFRTSGAKWETPLRMARQNSHFPAMAVSTTHGLLLANREYLTLEGERSTSGGLVIYDYRQNRRSVLQIHQGLPSNDLTAVAVDGRIAWLGGRGFVAVVDLQERKVLRIAYVSASTIRSIQLGKVHAWVQVSCGQEADPDDSGNAWTGIYRLNRSTIEPVAYTANRQ